ncbi:MAG: ribonuclease D [Henriciella sp.]|jgi:ribonuclease D|uniref:ribonuclease D n=1 Tax=Henriciella sp. TaxID=1968823 RepID=UPI000C106D1C|nr:ribonuclease D [Henriciella sp.]MAN73143.1 ribonuclease D [Henriciella sp.]MBF35416.1 ribonuclease D [Hyphomonadaceae bacterium]PHR79290.1 MAG: ribonuclease D [Henriciella sp.]|tara:strand:- start:1062 stop:2234 length:1173 start_codon:yes stop_codon:yes gene_type:complete
MTDKTLTPITKQEELQKFCDSLAASDFICVDTEFHRETTFWPELCLIQASAPGVEGVIDPKADGIDLQPFLDLLADTSRVKVFHAARQDMEIFNKLIGTPPAPVFDTQVAAMALGLGDSISYDNLIQRVLRRHIDKSSQFTDWKRRPLSDKQLAYALGDVTHLRDAYLWMRDELEKRGRMGWVAEEMESLSDPALYDTDPKNAWQRLKIRKTHKEYLAVFAAVAEWRERQAQTLDRPRRRILKDDAIQEIADQKPKTEDQFDRLRAVPKGFIRSRNADGLMQTVETALDDPDAHAPPAPKRKQNPQTPAGAPEMLKVLLKYVSEDVDVVPRLIANAADIERIARGETDDDIPALTGWRYDVFGQKARALLTGNLALSFENGQVRLFEPKS